MGARSTGRDLTPALWLLKLGAPLNLVLLAATWARAGGGGDPRVLLPATVFFAVSAYRCLFPVRYEGNVVLHDTCVSSIFVTRALATVSELAFVFLLSHVLRVANAGALPWVDVASWAMVGAAAVSQGFVWTAIATGRLGLYVWEESGWFLLMLANTVASAALLASSPQGGAVHAGIARLLWIDVAFGAAYLPWQTLHLWTLWREARRGGRTSDAAPGVPRTPFREGLRRALRERNRRTDAAAWGGAVGLTWMLGYWVVLLPPWVFEIARVLARG